MDPFPLQDNPYTIVGRLPTFHDDLVYPVSRFEEGNSPHTLYLPNRDMMFKIMRACVKITDPKDLWL